MSPDALPALFRESLVLLGIVGGPLFGVLLVVSLVVGVLQSVTQVQEPAVGAVPRLLTVVVVVMLSGGWMMERFSAFLRSAIERLADRGF
ncbi:MAG: flagellar biosynthetic protein FliQ [Myxococcaceae bacterium]|nr:flagellar biosynthetic protein FliQ [Myxococcaceae bacterium]